MNIPEETYGAHSNSKQAGNKYTGELRGADIHQEWDGYCSSCLGAKECIKRPPEDLSRPNFLSFYNKALRSKTSAKKEIKRNTLFIWHLLFVQRDILYAINMTPPFWQTIPSLDDSILINPLHLKWQRSGLINWRRGSRVSSPCLLYFDMLTAAFQRASPHTPQRQESGQLLNAHLKQAKHGSFLHTSFST